LEHPNKGGIIVEESHPVEQLGIHYKEGKSSDLLLQIDTSVNRVQHNCCQIEDKRSLINEVPEVGDIILESFCFELEVLECLKEDHIHDNEYF